MNVHSPSELVRGLRLSDAISIVVGSVIGTGIFLKTAPMLQEVGTPWLVLLAWLVAGLLSLAGAFTYAELGSLFPQTGGEFVYLHQAYGKIPAFLYGWARFGIAAPASIAAYAAGSATFLADGLQLSQPGFRQLFALGVILIFTLFNVARVQVGGRIQTFLTGLKIIMTLGLGVTLLIFARQGGLDHFTATWMPGDGTSGAPQNSPWSSFGMAMIAALWAYDGWNNLPMAAGEVKDAQKNVPRALMIGMALVFVIYLLLNVAYFFVLPVESIATASSKLFPEAPSVGALSVAQVFGESAMGILSFAFVVSALGAMNGSILTGARVPYAMAKEGLFFRHFAKVSSGTHVPVFSVIVQGIIAALLSLLGTFDQLTDTVVFSSWIFYAACAGTVFVFRRRQPQLIPTYRVPGYPFIPVLFILISLALLANTLWTMPKESGLGILFLLSGLLVFWWVQRNPLPRRP